jgi:hypothetical protein
MEYRIQAVLARLLREILFLDLDIGLLQYRPAVLGTLLARNYFGLNCGLLGFIKYSTPEPSSQENS